MAEKISDYAGRVITGDKAADAAFFKKIFEKDASFRIKELKIGGAPFSDCALMFMDGMVDGGRLDDAVVRPLLLMKGEISGDIADHIEKRVLFSCDTKKERRLDKIIEGILYGETLLLIDGSRDAIIIDAKGWRTRGISEPDDERVLQGPREGFDEAALLNLALIRRKLQTPDFCAEMLRVGRRTSTKVFVCYLGSLADGKTVAEIKRRIKKIDIDGILDSNYITEQIRDNKYSVFKTSGSTERPDIVAARLLEGRIAIVVDGTPAAVTVPYLFSENFQSDEDYYINFAVSSIGRLLRYLCFFLSVSVPAIFISLSTYHTELLPTTLAIAVARLRGGVPFSPFAECIILIFVFEILKETGVRMPQSLGHALSIVGGLVVGEAAVEARIISTPMLIIIALSGIAGLMVPRLKGAVFYLRIFLVFMAAFFDIYGFLVGLSVIVVRIISMSSFGVDYTVSLRKAGFSDLKDSLWRADWRRMIRRPLFNRNSIRQTEGKK